MLTVCTWIWGDKYGFDYVDKLSAGIDRNLKQQHRFLCFCVQQRDMYLTDIPGCFARLRMFDPEWQRYHGIASGDRLACLDLDVIITGALDRLFDRSEDFIILQGANAANPCPFNGSVMMLRGGAYPEVWTDFSVEAAAKIPFYAFPDDQGWLWHKLPKAVGWKCGVETGIWSFRKCGWPTDDALPKGARIVAFPGARDPSQFSHLGWVKEHWQ